MLFDRWRRDHHLEPAPGADVDPASPVVEPTGAVPPDVTGSPPGPAHDEPGEAPGEAPTDTAPSLTTMLAPARLDDLLAGTPASLAQGSLMGRLPDVAEAGLDVDEIAAYLEGRLVEHRSGRGRPVPAWAVLNTLAHGDPGELAALAVVPSEDPEPAWLTAQRALATDLLEDRELDAVDRIQREVLVPLELWLITRSETATVTGRWAAEMAEDVLATCRRHGS